MALGSTTQSVLSLINVVNTLIENFPMSIFAIFKGKQYDSVIEFLLDVLYVCGVDTDEIFGRILSKIFSNGGMDAVTSWLKRVKAASSEENLLDLLNEIEFGEPEVIGKIEEATGIAFANILASLITCSVYPVIPDWAMDESASKRNSGYLSLPVRAIDLCNKLSIMPGTSTGSCFYMVDSEKCFKRIPDINSLPLAYKRSFQIKVGDRDVPKYYNENKHKEKLPKVELYRGNLPSLENEGVTRYVAVYPSTIKDISNVKLSDLTFYRLTRTSKLSANDMYKADDLDAFIWYVLNRGQSMPQYEKNKMMWDSRHYVSTLFKRPQKGEQEQGGIQQASYIETSDRNKAAVVDNGVTISPNELWDNWLSSKQTVDGDIFLSSEKDSGGSIINNGGFSRDARLFPIMQLEKESDISNGQYLRVYISSQKYSRGAEIYNNYGNKKLDKNFLNVFVSPQTPNYSMYTFNRDYIRSIKFFSAKTLFASMIKQLFTSGILGMAANFSLNVYNPNADVYARLKKIVDGIILKDDFSVEDCYYTFSNEDYDDILYKGDLLSYNVVPTSNGEYVKSTITENDILDAIDSQNSSATIEGTITNMKRSVYNIATQQNDAESNISFYDARTPILVKFVYTLISPFLEALLSPKVMLLLLINLEVSGVFSFKNLKNNGDWSFIINFLMRKVLALMSIIILRIKDYIVEVFMELFREYVIPLIQAFMTLMLAEAINNWIKYLEDILNCLPTFKLDWKDYRAIISDVNYADIAIDDQITNSPESKSC